MAALMASATALDTLPVTDACLAELCGFTTRHIRTICAAAKVGRNSYAAGPAIKTIFEHMEGGGELGKRLLTERIRKVAADADKAEMEYALAKGEIAPIEQMAKAWEQRFGIIRANMLNIPARACMQIVGSTDEGHIKDTLRAEITTALKQAAEAEPDPEDLDEFETEEPEE
jgi:phage terminase Nu1 subunit (DNA packaging protein)